MAARPILSIVSLILLAGGIVLQFFVVLSGAVKGTPLNKVYFLQASTNGITSRTHAHIPNPARWTFFALCGVIGSNNGNCGPVHAAFPFNPPGKENFDTHTGIPQQFIGTDRYYLLSRFVFAFYLIALFFAVISLLFSLFALCARLGAYLAGMTTAVAFLFQTLAAALMTAWTVLAQHAFKKNGQSAKLGTYAYAFTWTAMFCFMVSTILFCVGGGTDKNTTTSSGSRGYFGRKRSTKSRGSFRDSESGRRVKDDYD